MSVDPNWRRAAAHAGAALTCVLLTLDDEPEHRRRLTGRVPVEQIVTDVLTRLALR